MNNFSVRHNYHTYCTTMWHPTGRAWFLRFRRQDVQKRSVAAAVAGPEVGRQQPRIPRRRPRLPQWRSHTKEGESGTSWRQNEDRQRQFHNQAGPEAATGYLGRCNEWFSELLPCGDSGTCSTSTLPQWSRSEIVTFIKNISTDTEKYYYFFKSRSHYAMFVSSNYTLTGINVHCAKAPPTLTIIAAMNVNRTRSERHWGFSRNNSSWKGKWGFSATKRWMSGR